MILKKESKASDTAHPHLQHLCCEQLRRVSKDISVEHCEVCIESCKDVSDVFRIEMSLSDLDECLPDISQCQQHMQLPECKREALLAS